MFVDDIISFVAERYSGRRQLGVRAALGEDKLQVIVINLYRHQLKLTRQKGCNEERSGLANFVAWMGGTTMCFGDPG